MKLSPRDAPRFFAKPETGRAGVLIFGADAMRVALKRQELIANLVGPEGEAEMRLTRIPASDLRKDPALLADAIKAQGFFPGPRVAFVEDAADGLVFAAPSSGRFYLRPGPDKPPFVRAGDTLTRGQAIGLLEVMKTFNRVQYGGAGLPSPARVRAVLVEDGDDVAAGDPLLQLERPASET